MYGMMWSEKLFDRPTYNCISKEKIRLVRISVDDLLSEWRREVREREAET